jgi:putative ABC transport system substrate-binding protein
LFPIATVEREGSMLKKPFQVFSLITGLIVGLGIVEAQRQSSRIGLLGPPEEPRFSEVRQGLEQGLREQGATAQAIELLEARVTREDRESVRKAVDSFLQHRVKVLVVIGSTLAKLAREVSAELPIVYLTPGDPVEQGLAASLARPGGNTTAMTFEYPELAGKRLEL